MRNIKVFLILITFALFCFSVSYADWQIQVVDSGEGVGNGSLSFALDSQNKPHIAYLKTTKTTNQATTIYSHSLLYAYLSDTWNIETLDTVNNTGVRISLSLDRANKPHLAYLLFSEKINILKYLYKKFARWHIDIVDDMTNLSTGEILDAALSIDKTNNPAIVYIMLQGEAGKWAGNNNIKYAYKNSDWTIEDVYETGGYAAYIDSSLSLAFDRMNNPHAFFTMGCISITSPEGGHAGETWSDKDIGLNYIFKNAVWSREQAVKGACSISEVSNITLDSNNQPWIAYYEDGLNLLMKQGLNWEKQTVTDYADDIMPLSLALDSHDRPHIVYSRQVDTSKFELIYTHYDDSMWKYDVVEAYSIPPFLWWDCSIKLDSNDNPHIVYSNQTNEIRYARWVENDNKCILEHITVNGKYLNVLRNYRDNVLSKTEGGRYIIRGYYQASEIFNHFIQLQIDACQAILEKLNW